MSERIGLVGAIGTRLLETGNRLTVFDRDCDEVAPPLEKGARRAESTQPAIDAGIDALKIPDALRGGRADSALLQEYLPRFATKDYRRQVLSTTWSRS